MPRIRWQRLRKISSARARRDWRERYAVRDAHGRTVRDEQNRAITTD